MDSKEEARRKRDEEIEKFKQEMLAGPATLKKTIDTTNSNNKEYTSSSSSSSSKSSNSSDSEEGEEEETIEDTPFSSSIQIQTNHSRAITSIAVDKSGSRIVTGSLDGVVLIWDGGLLSRDFKPFRSLAITSALTGSAADQAVVKISFNKPSLLFAVARRDSQVRGYDREGTNGAGNAQDAKFTTTKGDQYIRDMAQTKGHVGSVSGLEWSTIRDEVLFTSGELDGTIRLWDIENGPKALMGLEIACTHILKTPAKAGARTSILCFSRSRSSNQLAAGCSTNAVHLWDARMGGVFGALPNQTISMKSSDFECVNYDLDDSKLIICTKESCQVQDLRKPIEPLYTLNHSQIKYAEFYSKLLLIQTQQSVLVFDKNTGKFLSEYKTDAGETLTSNFVWKGDRFFMGTRDGILKVSFTEQSFLQFSRQQEIELKSHDQKKKRDELSYAKVNERQLIGEIMPAHEALKLVKGTKRMKGMHDLRDDFVNQQ